MRLLPVMMPPSDASGKSFGAWGIAKSERSRNFPRFPVSIFQRRAILQNLIPEGAAGSNTLCFAAASSGFKWHCWGGSACRQQTPCLGLLAEPPPPNSSILKVFRSFQATSPAFALPNPCRSRHLAIHQACAGFAREKPLWAASAGIASRRGATGRLLLTTDPRKPAWLFISCGTN